MVGSSLRPEETSDLRRQGGLAFIKGRADTACIRQGIGTLESEIADDRSNELLKIESRWRTTLCAGLRATRSGCISVLQFPRHGRPPYLPRCSIRVKRRMPPRHLHPVRLWRTTSGAATVGEFAAGTACDRDASPGPWNRKTGHPADPLDSRASRSKIIDSGGPTAGRSDDGRRTTTRKPDRNSEVPRLNIRPARVGDVPGIYELIRIFAERKLMIRRSMGELYESIREFLVAVDDEGRVVGCVALHVFWEDLAELRCLAVGRAPPGAWAGPPAGRRLLGIGARARDRVGLHPDARRRLLRAVRVSPGRQVRAAAQDLERMRALPAVPELPGNRADPLGRSRAGGGRCPALGPGRRRGVTLGTPDAHPRLVAAGVAVGLATAILMLATEPRLAIVWDEGYTLGREARLRDWFRALADPPGFAARWRPPAEELVQQDQTPPPGAARLDSRGEAALRSPGSWPGSGRSPGRSRTAIRRSMPCSAWSATSSPPSWQDLPRARLGPILLFSLTAGAIFAFAASPVGRLGGGPGRRLLGPPAEPVRPRPLCGL